MPFLALKKEGEKKQPLRPEALFVLTQLIQKENNLHEKPLPLRFLSCQFTPRRKCRVSFLQCCLLISSHCDGFLCKKQPELLQLTKSELANNYSSHSLFEEGQLRQLFRSEVELVLPGYRSARLNVSWENRKLHIYGF